MWGYSEHEAVESVQKLFLKKLFKLPPNTPNYVLYVETLTDKLFLFVLQTHLKYITKVNLLPDNRLPKILAEQIIQKNIFWYRELKLLARRFGKVLDFQTGETDIQRQMWELVEAVEAGWRADRVGRARTAQFHQQYLIMDLNLGDRGYISDNTNMQVMSWVLKIRAELLHLNYKPWQVEQNFTCSLCNWRENETVYHFIARCPVLGHFRRIWLGRSLLSREEYEEYLNGRDWLALVNYAKHAWQYRWDLIQEFNV